jgi:hypothetical protein
MTDSDLIVNKSHVLTEVDLAVFFVRPRFVSGRGSYVYYETWRSSCKVPVILVRFEWKLNFLDRFSKNTQMSNLMKIRRVGAELFHADGQTDGQTDRHIHRRT